MTLLLLAGTGDARHIATQVRGDVIASLAGATRDPASLDVPVRTGGFGGAQGFSTYLKQKQISAVLDATHPYAARITARSAAICANMGVPYLQYLRPSWQPEPGDDWTDITREEDAAALIPQSATIFLGTGRQTLDKFANLEGRRVICRQIDPPTKAFPFEGGEFLIGRPPFTVSDEVTLFRQLGITHLIVKNAGGVASRTKLTAARLLNIKVLMIGRPPQGDWPVVSNIADAVDWANAL